MPSKRKPAYTLHKGTGQARVRIGGKDHYLGPYGSAESQERYGELISDWIIKNDVACFCLTIDDLCLKFQAFADAYYRRKNGTPTGTSNNVRLALRYIVKMFGTTRVRDFGPRRLKEVRERMINDGRCRTDINRQVHWIRRAFRWGVEEELVPVQILQALAAVNGLKAGRSAARESEPVQPVPDEIVNATLPHLPDVVADMVRFQRLTGCRPGEVCSIRPCDVDRRGEVWRYVPHEHKTEHHGIERVIAIGPKAQAILRPYLLRESTAYCFSPADSDSQQRAERHEDRQTPLSCGNIPGSNRKQRPKRKPGNRYNKDSYGRAVSRACALAFPLPENLARRPKESFRAWKKRLSPAEQSQVHEWRSRHSWSPNQLRHTAATVIREKFGLEAAQVALGHTHARVTQVYAERNLKLAASVMLEVG